MKRIVIVLILFVLGGQVALAQGDDIRRIAQSVVLVGIVENGELVGNGSGTIVTPTGLIYTNRHVIEDADGLAIFMLDDIQELPVLRYYAEPVFISEQIDFAAIQINADADGNPVDPATLDLPFLEPSLQPVDIGDQLRVFGYPVIGDGYMVVTSGEVVTIQNGAVSGSRLPVWYRTDSEFSGGNSGGLAVSASGQFVGLPTWVRTEDLTDGKLGGVLPMVTVDAVLAAAGVTDRPGQGSGGQPPTVNQPPAQPDQPAQQPTEDVTFTLVNNAQTAVCYVFISPTTASTWGADQLSAQETVPPAANRTWTLEPNFYDILLRDCNNETLDDIRSVDLTTSGQYTLGDTEQPPTVNQPPSTASGVEVSCEGGTTFSNGAEIIIRGMPASETYRVTVIGLNGFDPVLAVLDTTTGQGTCVDDAQEVALYAAELPTTGAVTGAGLGAQLTFAQDTGVALADKAIVVGGYENAGGEFLVIVEGVQLTDQDRGGDLFSVRLTPGTVNSGVPLTAYMGGLSDGVDPLIYLADPNTLDVFVTDDGTLVACDDGGLPDCFGESVDLRGSSLQTGDGTYVFETVDTLLSIPLQGLEVTVNDPMYFNLGMSSFQGASRGVYVAIFHMGIE